MLLTKLTNFSRSGMLTVSTYEAKTHLSSILNRALAGEKVIICRGKKPLVELTPISRRKSGGSLTAHPVLGRIKINYDPVEVLSEEEFPKEYQ